MNNDLKMFKWLGVLVFIPVILAAFGSDGFRYPCQDVNNWDKDICKKPTCDITRTCPEHIFKGQKDPRMMEELITPPVSIQGADCAK